MQSSAAVSASERSGSARNGARIGERGADGGVGAVLGDEKLAETLRARHGNSTSLTKEIEDVVPSISVRTARIGGLLIAGLLIGSA